MRVYLSGPMTGIQHFNYPAFEAAAAALRNCGHDVFSPVENDIQTFVTDISNPDGCPLQAASEHGFDRRAALKADLAWICDHAEAIALLPGWERSFGACAEHALAVALGLKIIPINGTHLARFSPAERVRRRLLAGWAGLAHAWTRLLSSVRSSRFSKSSVARQENSDERIQKRGILLQERGFLFHGGSGKGGCHHV